MKKYKVWFNRTTEQMMSVYVEAGNEEEAYAIAHNKRDFEEEGTKAMWDSATEITEVN